MRLFVSIDLPEDLADAIAAVQDRLEPADGLRMTDPAQAHVTLKFLGEVGEDRVEAITEGLSTAVDVAGVPSFEASVGGIGVFPELSYIRVVWLGVDEGADSMARLQEAVEGALVDRGFEPAEHAFTPHVTIARMDHAGGKDLVQQVVTELDPDIGAMQVDAISLTESSLTPDGPTYKTVQRFELPTAVA